MSKRPSNDAHHGAEHLGALTGSTRSPDALSEAPLASALAGPWLLPEPRVRVDTLVFEGAAFAIVRDDLLHPIAGGNKLRKLDGLLPGLIADGVTDIITCGGVQSSHASATACCCAERGVGAHLMLRGEPLAVPTGYALLSHLYGDVQYVDRTTYRTRPAFMHAYAARLRDAGRRVAVIPEGARCVEALLGLVRLVRGLAEALALAGLDPSAPWSLVVDSGTGTSAVGLAVGIALSGMPWTVEAVCLIAGAEPMFAAAVDELLGGWTARYGQLPSQLPLTWVERGRPRRFGKVLPGELPRCRSFAQQTGVLVDPIYTLAAVDHVLAMPGERRGRALQVHTGGLFNAMGLAQRTPAGYR